MTNIPVDWPPPGTIDLERHDRPHASATLEWWYVNAHLDADDGTRYALFAAFFRTIRKAEHAEGEPTHVRAVTWRLTDLSTGRDTTVSLLEDTVMAEMRRMLSREEDVPFMRRALVELLDQGKIPLPDRPMQAPPTLRMDRLEIDMDGQRFWKGDDGRYHLELAAPGGGTRVALTFTLMMPVVRHGDDGVVRGVGAEEMFYYFCPRCDVAGTIDAGTPTTVAGAGWYDHEFGYVPDERRERAEDARISWNWIAAQLDDGWQLTAYDLFDQANGEAMVGHWLIAVDPAGNRHVVHDFTLRPESDWTSSRTFIRWPVRWRLQIPALELDLVAKAPVPAQEFQTVLAPPAFWEGRVDVRGAHAGTTVTGRGFVERNLGGKANINIRSFLSDVGAETREILRALLPDALDHELASRLVSRPDSYVPMDAAALRCLSTKLVAPVRHVVELGGKAWRSYALLACIDLVGGDSQRYLDWLAVPELIHTGSLIVDDVQDNSTVRRKGQPAHAIWGSALAINAGTAAYFWGQQIINQSDLPLADKIRVYELYFYTMRAAHAGQALDIAGHRDLLDEVLATGKSATLERRVLETHRLKSAVPAGNLARIGAVVGGGSEEQEHALGTYFETLGVAFQIMDDVLNLDGFEAGQKETGEDLREAKLTFPIARALHLLPEQGRRRLTELLNLPERSEGEVAEGVALVSESGALRSSRAEADALLEGGWKALSPHLVDTEGKARLRAFSWFLLDRHY